MSCASPELWIGLASADITPEVGVTLTGYRPRISTTVSHPLRAQAICCSDRSGTWLVIVGDFLGIRLEETRRVRSVIARRTGIPEHAIAVAGTHTHSGPATVLGPEEIGPPDQRYLARLWDTLAGLGVEAHRLLEPASLDALSVAVPGLGSNRRVQRGDGTWDNEWRDPEGRHSGFFDPTALAVGIKGRDGMRRGLLLNYGVHPVVLGPESLAVSADYPGYAREALENRGLAPTAVFLLSGAGNINPRVCIETDPALAERMGSKLAAEVVEALPRSSSIGSGPVRAATLPWDIRRTRDAYKGKGGPGTLAGETVRTELQAFRAGELALVCVPAELFSELTGSLRALSPCAWTVVVTLANDYIGYLPTDAAQAEGAYETLMAPALGVEKSLLSRARELFEMLADRDRPGEERS